VGYAKSRTNAYGRLEWNAVNACEGGRDRGNRELFEYCEERRCELSLWSVDRRAWGEVIIGDSPIWVEGDVVGVTVSVGELGGMAVAMIDGSLSRS
jgi:hypothetical protein